MGNGTSTSQKSSTVTSEEAGGARKVGLTGLDVQVIRESWDSIKDKKGLGEQVFRELFILYPQIKQSFKFKDIPIDEIVRLDRFAEHAANFTAFLKVIVSSLENEEKVLSLAQAIGTKHAVMAVFDSTLFDPSYWISFAFIAAKKISAASQGDGARQNLVQKTWQVLLFRLVIEMQVRFYKDLLDTRGSVIIKTNETTAEELLREAKEETLKSQALETQSMGRSKRDDDYYDDDDQGRSSSTNRFYTRVDEEKPINIWVYPNGLEFDPGIPVHVTRRNYRNWVALLEYLTSRLKLSSGAIHRIYDLDGRECRHFRDLEDEEEYVAATGRFIDVEYGKGRKKGRKWEMNTNVADGPNPAPLDSNQSLQMYLERNDYKPYLDDMWDDTSFDLRRGGDGRDSRDRRSKSKDDRRSKSESRSSRRKRSSRDRDRNSSRDRDGRSSRDRDRRNSRDRDDSRDRDRNRGRRSKSPKDKKRSNSKDRNRGKDDYDYNYYEPNDYEDYEYYRRR